MGEKENMDEVARWFAGDTAQHRLTVLRDDGLYRHLRFRRHVTRDDGTASPSWQYWFDLVTWPGNLVIRGDMGTFAFARQAYLDVAAFFRRQRVNPGYWAEKLKAPAPAGVLEYSEDLFRQVVFEMFSDAARAGTAPRGTAAALREALTINETGSEDAARQVLADFKHDGFRFHDTWELDFRTWSYPYLWCCHAIVWGIARYDEAKAATWRARARRWLAARHLTGKAARHG